MKRVVKTPEIRKQELIDIALKQFLERGYHKTSIRGILVEADGEIGMFYHYFKSKDEIFRCALERYNELFLSRFLQIAEDKTLTPRQRISEIITYTLESISEYKAIESGEVDTEIKTILLGNMLRIMEPVYEKLIVEIMQNSNDQGNKFDIRILTRFLLYGTSAVLHDNSITDSNNKKNQIELILNKFLVL